MADSIMQRRKECYICRYRYGVSTVDTLEEHHVLNGPLRSFSERYGLKVWLCHRHHNEPPDGVHHNAEMMDWMKSCGQLAFETWYGHDRWIKEVGKDYWNAQHRSNHGASGR